jgi:hypothetical protein
MIGAVEGAPILPAWRAVEMVGGMFGGDFRPRRLR